MPSPLELHEATRVLSSRMVAAARADDWYGQTEFERGSGGLAAGRTGGYALLIDPARRQTLVHCILENDADVPRPTRRWLADVRPLLDGREKFGSVSNVGAGGDGGSAKLRERRS